MRPFALGALLAVIGLATIPTTAPGQADGDGVPLARIVKLVVDDQDRLEATDTEVRVIRARSGSLVAARRAVALFEDDQVITGANVSLVLLFEGQAAEEEKTAIVGPASQLRVRSRASLFLILGRILFNVRGFFEVERPEGVLGAKGTEFEVQAGDDGATRLLVLQGSVGVGTKGTASAPSPSPGPPPALRAKVTAGRSGSSAVSFTVRNGCQEPHTHEVRAPDTLPWVSLVGERFVVEPGTLKTVELTLKLDASRMAAGTYRGDVTVKCLDCDREAGCSIAPHPIPFEVVVTDASGAGPPTGGSPGRAGPLEELMLGRGAAGEVRAATEIGVRKAIEWSSRVLLTGRPAYVRSGSPLYIESVESRDATFKNARFRAVWERSADAYQSLGNVYCDWGEGAKGLEAYERAGKADPARHTSAEYEDGVAEAYRLKGRLEDAETHVRRSLGLDPRRAPALVILGNIRRDEAGIASDHGDAARARDRLEAALRAFSEASRLEPGPPVEAVARANQGEALLTLGHLARQEGKRDEAQARFGEAEKSFQAAQQIHPPYPYSSPGLAGAYRGYFGVALLRGDKAGAESHFRRAEEIYALAIKEGRGSFMAWTGLGTLYADVGRDDRAVEAYGHAVELSPDEPLAYWHLGSMLAKTQPERAAEYLRTYMALEAPAFKQGQRAKQAVAMMKGEATPPPSTIPGVQGLDPQAAEQRLRAAGFTLGAVDRRPSTQPPGTVIEQNPKAGTPAPRGARVDVVVAVATAVVADVKVPKVVGDKEEDALRDLGKQGLVARVVREAACEKLGRIRRQEPAGDARVPRGSTVTIAVASVGTDPTTVPAVEKLPRNRAEERLRQSGLVAGRIRTVQTSDMAPGLVVRQDPRAGEAIAANCSVDLTVAEAVPLVTVPDFRGMAEKDALSRLGFFAGLVGGLTKGQVYGQGTGGRVVRQSPEPGAQVPRGSTVDLWIEGRGTPDTGHGDLVTVPHVRGLPLKNAVSRIQGAGLAAAVKGRGPCAADQSPAEGRLPRGNTVTIYAGACQTID